MTIVVYKNGVIAADSRATLNETIMSDKIIKVAKGPGCIGGGSGDLSEVTRLLEWIREGGKLEDLKKDAFWGMVAYSRPNKKVSVFRIEGKNSFYEVPLDKDDFVACGTGREVAIGALTMGASPEQAVAAAIKHVSSCGGKINKVSLEGFS